MSSKRHQGGGGIASRPVNWREANPQALHTLPAASGGPPGEDSANWKEKIAQLEAEMARRQEQARQDGFREAEAACLRKFENRQMEMAATLAKSVEQLSGFRDRFRRQAEQDLVRLSLAVARRIVRRELTVDPDAIRGLAKAALDTLDARELCRVRVHPEDAAAVRRTLDSAQVPPRVEVVSDASLERGGIIFECQQGNLDASLETQLEEIGRGFADLIRSKP